MHATSADSSEKANMKSIPGAGAPPSQDAWHNTFNQALPYQKFLDEFATGDQREKWDTIHSKIQLTTEHKTLLEGFVRRMPVIVLCGTWCGDCVNQCPIFEHFDSISDALDVRFLDRDACPDMAAHLKVCGGQRVPTVVFLSEDWYPVLVYGDKTLSAYRSASCEQNVGSSCSTGLVSPDSDSTAAVISDWLDQFERVQLILRLSGRLRQVHGD